MACFRKMALLCSLLMLLTVSVSGEEETEAGAVPEEAEEAPAGKECPERILPAAQRCFADLASGVTQTDRLTMAGSMPLDYKKIREYCQEDGHMSKFLTCINDLLTRCENRPELAELLQLINPDRVRTSVPNLCKNVEVIEESAECMNTHMNKPSDCKTQAYSMIKQGMAETTGNASAMITVQCRFFAVLAECQRSAVTEHCGDTIGDLHANFLLSFVPNSCAGDVPDHILVHVTKGNQSDADAANVTDVTDDVTTSAPKDPTSTTPSVPAPTAVVRTLAPPDSEQEGDDVKPASDPEANGGRAISGHVILAAALSFFIGLGMSLLST